LPTARASPCQWFVRTQTNGSRTYLLIVDNVRVDGKVKQRILHRLGRLDELLASGQLDSLVQSLGRFSEKLAVLGAHTQGDSVVTHSARIGPALIFQRLCWNEPNRSSCAAIKGRDFGAAAPLSGAQRSFAASLGFTLAARTELAWAAV
jgi:hypothetical protein